MFGFVRKSEQTKKYDNEHEHEHEHEPKGTEIEETKEQVVKVKPIIFKNELVLWLNDKTTLSWLFTPYTGNNIHKPWINFLNWLHEKDTPYFVFTANKGKTETMVRRQDILRYSINISPK